MMKTKSFISAYSGLQCSICAGCCSTTSTSPSLLPIPRARPQTERQKKPPRWRSYASAHSSQGPDFRNNMNWPCSKTAASIPTPYEIFQIEKNAKYSKHRYYELVKIYHPDKHAKLPCDGLTTLERLERYRLVVQAHEILSNPEKRKAYDAYGAGWQNPRSEASRHTRGHHNPEGRAYGYGPYHDNSPFANATWEDWERWYRRPYPSDGSQSADSAKDKYQYYAGTYLNPNAFASFVILLAVLSGIAQATRAGQYSGALEESARAFTEETSRFLQERRSSEGFVERSGAKGDSIDGRIKHFLEKRDPSRYGLKDEEEETYRKHFSGNGSGHIPTAVESPQATPTARAIANNDSTVETSVQRTGKSVDE